MKQLELITILPEQVDHARLLTLRTALKLEIQGLKSRGRYAYTIIKEELGIKGSRASVLEQVNEHLNQN